MINLPSILEGKACYRSEFHYIIYQEISKTEPLDCRAICVTYYHDNILSPSDYKELHLNSKDIHIASVVQGTVPVSIPISQEEYYIRSQAFEEDKFMRLSLMFKALVKPPNFMHTIWLATVLFLSGLLLLIYQYSLFAKGFTLPVILALVTTCFLSGIVAVFYSYIKSYLGIKITSIYLKKFNSERYFNGVVVWLAIEYGLLNENTLQKALEVSLGDDELVEYLSDVYQPCFDPNVIEASAMKLLNKLHTE